jgi:hypothetical protein
MTTKLALKKILKVLLHTEEFILIQENARSDEPL